MQCVEQDSSCLPAGLPEDDQDYYIEAKHNKPVTDINTEVKDQGPVISVEVVVSLLQIRPNIKKGRSLL